MKKTVKAFAVIGSFYGRETILYWPPGGEQQFQLRVSDQMDIYKDKRDAQKMVQIWERNTGANSYVVPCTITYTISKRRRSGNSKSSNRGRKG